MNTLHTDVVVIGSGPIAAVYARRAAEADLQVVIIEAGSPAGYPVGGHLRNSRYYHLFPDQFSQQISAHLRPLSVAAFGDVPVETSRSGRHINREQNSDLGLPAAGSTSAVGGMFTHWTAVCPRPHRVERTALLSDTEWDQHLTDAERLLGVRVDELDGPASMAIVDHLAQNLRRSNGAQAPLDVDRPVQRLPVAARISDQGDRRIHWTSMIDVLGNDFDKNPHRAIRLLADHQAYQIEHEAGTATAVLATCHTSGTSTRCPS